MENDWSANQCLNQKYYVAAIDLLQGIDLILMLTCQLFKVIHCTMRVR